MTQNVLIQNGKIVPRRTCRPLTLAEQNSKAEQDMRDAFDKDVKVKLGDSITIVKEAPTKLGAEDDIDEQEEPTFIPEEDPIDSVGRPVYEQPLTDIEVFLLQGKEMKSAKV